MLAALPFSSAFLQPSADESLLNPQLMQESLQVTKHFRKRALWFLRQQLWFCFHIPMPICHHCAGVAGLCNPSLRTTYSVQTCSCAKGYFDPGELCSFLISSVGNKVPGVKRAACFKQRKSYGSTDMRPCHPNPTDSSRKNDLFLNGIMV